MPACPPAECPASRRPGSWLRCYKVKGARGDGQENRGSWAPIPEVALAATQGQLPPEFCQHVALAQLDAATVLVGATLAGHTHTLEQTSWEIRGGHLGETKRCLSWTGLWLVEMKPGCGGGGTLSNTDILHLRPLHRPNFFNDFFFFKYVSWLPQGHCQELQEGFPSCSLTRAP